MIIPANSSEDGAPLRFNKVSLFLNADSGRSAGRKLLTPFEREFCSRGIVPEIFETSSAQDLEVLAAHQIKQGARLLFAAGGDGTLQGLVNASFGFDVVLGVIPVGGGNDFARALGLPDDPQGALASSLAGEPRFVDLARVRTANGRQRFYLGGGGTGLDAESAIHAATRYRNWPGRSRYIASALRAYFAHRPNRVRVTLENGEELPWQTFILASVLNTPTFGAGIRLTPKAQINDGLLDFAFLEELKLRHLVRILPRLAIRGTLDIPQLRITQIRKVRLETEFPAFFQCDGEILGPTPVEIEVLPSAIRFLSPICASC